MRINTAFFEKLFGTYTAAFADIAAAFAGAAKESGVLTALVQPVNTPNLKRPKDYRPPKKIEAPVMHVGPRTRRNFERRGRRRI